MNQNKHPVDRETYLHGIRLFNEGKFFAAHEVLEDVWRAAPPEQKKFLQGLIQLAVALHHHSTGNKVGAASVLRRAVRNISCETTDRRGIRVPVLLDSIRKCEQAIKQGLPLGSIPRLDEPEC